MTTFAPTATKTNRPLQLFTMFPPGGASTLKSFTPSFGNSTTTTTTSASTTTTTTTTGGGNGGGSGSVASDRHHVLHQQHQFHSQQQRLEEDATRLEQLHHPVRPVRHVQQHAAQWAETKTTVAPGLIVRSTTATVSQWSEYCTSSVQQTTEVSRTSSTQQFQTIRTQTIAASQATALPAITSAQYLDDLKLPTQQLDLAVQLGKGSIARKGSLGGRRPPTIRCRRSSQGSLAYQEQQQEKEIATVPMIVPITTTGSNTIPSAANGSEPIRSGRSKTPPPRPPPPVFRQAEQLRPVSPVHLAPPTLPPPPPPTDWSCSRSGTPPSLPANSPPPLPEREDLDFVMELSSSACSSPIPADQQPTNVATAAVTDVVEINDKESVGEDGQVVRRRTIITLGRRMAAPSDGSSSSINVKLLNGSSSAAASCSQPESTAAKEETRPAARVSAFNARRTIEQRRQQQQQQINQQNPPTTARESSPDPLPTTIQPAVQPAKTPPSSTYLYGEQGSPASSSFGGSSLRTMSISMSFDDLESNASMTDVQRRAGGRNRTEAWYERRQSYGFEAADKLQSLLNTSGSSDVPSTGAISRSCDSLSSTVRSTSSAIDKMIPPWIKNPSPVSSRQPEEETRRLPAGPSAPSSYFDGSVDDVSQSERTERQSGPVASSPIPSPIPSPRTPTPSIQRSESSRSATNVLEEAEPIWLRDLRVRRSLRDGRRKRPVIKSPPPVETPVWLGVKLRPTGLSLVDPDPADPPSAQLSPIKPHYTPIFTFTNTSTSSKIQQLFKNSRENLFNTSSQPEAGRKPEEPTVVPVSSDRSKEDRPAGSQPSDRQDNFIRLPVNQKPARKASSSIVMINSSRESLHSIGTDAASTASEPGGNQLNHHRSIELMRMLEETPLVSTNRRLDDRMDSTSAITETGSIYSAGEWTECSSAVASVKNSNEDLTRSQSEVRKAKKVAFGADVKEESDQKRSRPRRIRSRSPESRLRQWQEKLEEVKSIHGIHSSDLANFNGHPLSNNGLPLKRFGDDTADQPESLVTPPTATSDTFRSLLQPRKGDAVTTPAVKESIVIDTYPTMKVSSGPADVIRPSPTIIRNGIVNFDSSIERKIVILETETVPAPKSILKKRSIENLLDSIEPIPPVLTVPSIPSVQSGITVSMTNQKKEPLATEQQEILPWRIHLKHVESAGIQVKVSQSIKDVVVNPQPEVPVWRSEIIRKKTPPFTAVRSSTPENLLRGRSPSVVSEVSATIPGMSAAELIRNLRPSLSATPVMMVARCQVRESVFRPPIETDTEEVEPSVRADHGYHSLEADVESGSVKRTSLRSTVVVDQSKTIDETIAQLNETIEEIRSLDVRTEPEAIEMIGAKRESSPPTNSIPSRLGDNSRFIIREIRPSTGPKESTTTPEKDAIPRNFFQSTSKLISHQSIVTSNYQQQPETMTSSVNQQRLRKITPTVGWPVSTTASVAAGGSPSLLKGRDGRAQLGADLKETIENGSRVSDATTTITSTTVKTEDRQSFVTASGVGRDDANHTPTSKGVTAVHLHIPVYHKQPTTVESADLTESSVEELVNKFESSETIQTADSATDSVAIRKKSTIQSVSSLSSRASTTSTTTTSTRLRTIQSPKKKTPTPLLSTIQPEKAVTPNKTQPAKRSNSIELTSGMPEEKAALLVRKFFGNSIIETKKSRITKTETIMEESSELSYNSSVCEEKPEEKPDPVAAATAAPIPVDSSFDSDELFRPSSRSEVMSSSSFGSALDVMETTTDDDRSIRTASSMTLTNTTRYSSCSERSVKLSDIINRPDRPSLMDSAPSTRPATPLDDFSYATSESASIAISLSQTTTDTSSSGSASRSGSIRRNKTQRHPTVIRRDRNGVQTVAPKTPSTRSRLTSASSGAGLRSSTSVSSSTISSTSASRRRSTATSKSSDPVKSTKIENKSAGTNGKHLATVPVRPPRTLGPVNQSTSIRKKSSTRISSSTSRSSTVAQPSKTLSAGTRSSISRSSAVPAERKVSSSTASQIPLANRTNRLVTITSYKSRASTTKPDDISAVSGIKVTPVAVGANHYKIRMDQRIAAAAAVDKSTAHKTSHRTSTSATSSTTEKRTISSRKTTTKS